ncbi:hypothetical protein CIW52_19895 [Mycolicibacterium sp. P9-64]|uniref:DUF7159 family protein n=1 Tax=Mycolicibacterium sp. P9-64 TaxID=2024612 RepID=UPI0011EBDE33|nr:hypothetical protein [Mycolicibacterium sp. P9-64]KAA0081951.1 hypothetical protein CIW52_19895 [Mycolicibacterium sp. P9-64]
MDAVLGLSMTPTSVGLVLVEGQDADGATMDRDAFDVYQSSIQSSEQATAAVLRTEALAANRGLRLNSIGVTWSEDADAQATALLQSLSDSGFDNVVAIRLPEATEALARGMAAVIGYQTTAVCVIEPDAVISLVVNTSDGAVQTAFNHSIDSDESLISWLSTVFTKADWQPEALVVVGSAGGFESILHKLEDALSVPVFAPAEAELALARGAALASAQTIELPRVDYDTDYSDFGGEYAHEYGYDKSRTTGRHRSAEPADGRSMVLGHTGAVTLLVAGVVTFVASVSIAVSLELAPHRAVRSADPVPAAVNEPQKPEAVRAIPPAMPPVSIPAPQAVEPVAPPPEAPVDPAPPETYVPAEAPITDEAPIADPAIPEAPPADVPPVDPAMAPPPQDALAPSPDAVPTIDSTEPTKKPGIWTRIKDRLTPGNDIPPADGATPAEVVPPPVP